MPCSLKGSVSVRDQASQLTRCVWPMCHDMPVQQQYMEGTVIIQKTKVVVGLSVQQCCSSWRICVEIGTADIIPRKVVCNEFLGSSDYYYFCFVFV